MADFDIPQLAPRSALDGLDDDLIDYDSDELKLPDSKQAATPSQEHIFDVGETSFEAEPAVRDASEPVETTLAVDTFSEAASSSANNPRQQGDDAASEQYPDDLDEFAPEDGTMAEDSGLAAVSIGHERGSIHEIDYEDDYASEENDGGNGQHLSSAPHDQLQASVAESSLHTQSVDTKAGAEHYEIDWEEDEVVNEYAARDAIEGEVMPFNDPDSPVGHEAAETGEDGLDPAHQGIRADESADAPELSQSDNFPAITVQYRGEIFPFFSLFSDGFFSDVSILDETMQTVLEGFRSELAGEIGPQDELVFQVDKLGLEFSESSPRDALSVITMRQMLELFEILVKNQDPESARTLYTFLFTKPNAMKRYQFLVESATGGKGLAEVMHLFQPPYNGSKLEAINAMDGYNEQLDSFESAGDENAACGSHEHVDGYEEGVEDEEATHDDDVHIGNYDGENYDGDDEHDVNHDEDIVDYDTGDRIAETDGGEGHVDHPESANTGHDEDPIGYSTDDKIDANDNDGHAADYANITNVEPTAVDDDDSIDHSTGDKMPAYAHSGQACDPQSAGDTRSVERDSDLIDGSKTGAKVAVDDGASRLINEQGATNGNIANQDSDLIDYSTSHRFSTDNDLIDYEESAGEQGNDGPQQEAEVTQQAGQGNDGQHVEHDPDLIDYSTGDKYAATDNVVKYDENDPDLIDYSTSDKYAAADNDVAGHYEPGRGSNEPAHEKLAASEESQVTTRSPDHSHTVSGVDGNVADPLEEPRNSHLQAGAHHGRNISDVSMTFSAVEADRGTPARADSTTKRLLKINFDEPAEEADDVDWLAGDYHVEGGVAATGTADSSTTATLRDNGDVASTPGDAPTSVNPPASQDEVAEIDWNDDAVSAVGGAADAPSNSMKRTFPAGLGGENGNDVKRRRS